MDTGRLELPLPDLGGSLETRAKEMQASIRAQVPEEYRRSIVVKAYRKGKATGVAIEYDDRAENFVFTAIEYPRGGRRSESIEP